MSAQCRTIDGMVSTGVRRLVDWYRTQRTLAAVANRECRHDGSDPMCDDCLRNHGGM